MFFENFDDNTEIHIAPGNHDFGFQNQFLQSVFESALSKNGLKNKYPYFFIDSDVLMIIDNSNKADLDFNKINFFIKNFGANKEVYIIRHHIFPKSLRWSANMKGHKC